MYDSAVFLCSLKPHTELLYAYSFMNIDVKNGNEVHWL